MSARHLAILLWATDPAVPQLCATPFFHAAVAAAMDAEVELHFAGRSVQLLVEGVAAALVADRDGKVSVYHHMREAARHGARFLACSDALDTHGLAGATMIPELAGTAGAAAFVARALDPAWCTLVY